MEQGQQNHKQELQCLRQQLAADKEQLMHEARLRKEEKEVSAYQARMVTSPSRSLALYVLQMRPCIYTLAVLKNLFCFF